jgi:hypothetical protein
MMNVGTRGGGEVGLDVGKVGAEISSAFRTEIQINNGYCT